MFVFVLNILFPYTKQKRIPNTNWLIQQQSSISSTFIQVCIHVYYMFDCKTVWLMAHITVFKQPKSFKFVVDLDEQHVQRLRQSRFSNCLKLQEVPKTTIYTNDSKESKILLNPRQNKVPSSWKREYKQIHLLLYSTRLLKFIYLQKPECLCCKRERLSGLLKIL